MVHLVRFSEIWWDMVRFGEIWWYLADFDEILSDSIGFSEIKWDIGRFGSKYDHQSAILGNIEISKGPH